MILHILVQYVCIGLIDLSVSFDVSLPACIWKLNVCSEDLGCTCSFGKPHACMHVCTHIYSYTHISCILSLAAVCSAEVGNSVSLVCFETKLLNDYDGICFASLIYIL
jgi:hypothetical protein